MNGFPPAFAAPAAAALLALPASGEAPAGDGPALPESRLLFPAAGKARAASLALQSRERA